mmetsp:Transcript_18151/g.35079  ORF Transcript_18151/g.35079 Transcript_18151/m.35079 type:complete len:81 (+) Transcript_18151:559-801(+)
MMRYLVVLQLPPFYRREQEVVANAVGSCCLQYIREEQEIIVSVLRDQAVNEEGKQKAAIAAAICAAIDQVSMFMPQVDDE